MPLVQPLKRVAAAQECLNKCRELLRESAPVLFFPEARLAPPTRPTCAHARRGA
jgi:hypothetical protein